MKEIISAVLFVVSLYAGTTALSNIHKYIRKAALTKASQGLPSLTGFSKSLKNNSANKDESD